VREAAEAVPPLGDRAVPPRADRHPAPRPPDLFARPAQARHWGCGPNFAAIVALVQLRDREIDHGPASGVVFGPHCGRCTPRRGRASATPRRGVRHKNMAQLRAPSATVDSTRDAPHSRVAPLTNTISHESRHFNGQGLSACSDARAASRRGYGIAGDGHGAVRVDFV